MKLFKSLFNKGSKKPVIGITAARKKYIPGAWAAYCYLTLAGAKCKILKPGSEKTIDLNGLVISGGSDLEPWYYGGKVLIESYPYDHERDCFEMPLIEFCIKKKLPLLGICRGSQLINVALGGNLHPDVRPLKQGNHPYSPFLCSRVSVNQDTRLSRIMEVDECSINSLHYQSCDKLGKGLIVSARDKEGIVQAIEHTKQWLVGIQWHPEYLVYLAAHKNILKHLKRAADDFPALSVNLSAATEQSNICLNRS